VLVGSWYENLAGLGQTFERELWHDDSMSNLVSSHQHFQYLLPETVSNKEQKKKKGATYDVGLQHYLPAAEK